jgi:hypothetical protein
MVACSRYLAKGEPAIAMPACYLERPMARFTDPRVVTPFAGKTSFSR